ncbi:MAG TPA: hypothetical protein OIM45_03430 [Clostridiaceae bacterium]|nr:hypothetical protein [Clostridiaceae bacterium]
MKRFIAILLAVVMCLSMSVVAFAAESLPDTMDKANIVVEDDGWTLLEGPATTEGLNFVTYGGTETWDYTGYYMQYVGHFTMYGYNLTPVKTIGQSNLNKYLRIRTNFTCSSSSILTVQIRDYSTGNVLAQNTSNATTSDSVWVGANVTSGQKVQIYFKVTDSYGNYSPSRACDITYYYSLGGI